MIRRMGDHAGAREYLERARAIVKASMPDHQYMALILNSLALLNLSTGDYAEAETLRPETLPSA